MRTRFFHAVAACAVVVGVCSCRSSSSNASADSFDAGAATAAPPSSASAASAAPAPSPATSGSAAKNPLAIPGATVATLPNMSFPERFALEAKGRPAGIKPTAEDVFTALKAAGLEIVDIKQHLAAPQGARFCLGARAIDKNKELLLDLSACEYSTPDVARVGRDYSIESMKTVIPNRTIYVNKQTTLIVREDKKTPENDALVEKASAAFAKL